VPFQTTVGPVTTRRVLVVQHAAAEGPGNIVRALASRQLETSIVQPFAGDRVPDTVDDVAGLVILGGPMGIADVPRLAHLGDEMKLIETALRGEVPILGICLGSQLLAHVLGARVAPAGRMEVGWHTVSLSEAGLLDGLFKGLESSFPALHWHGDAFDLPAGATSLARSKLTDHQAFRHGSSAYGLLFHLEATRQIVDDLVGSFPEDLTRAALTSSDVLAAADEHLISMAERGDRVFSAWGDLAAARRDVA
jgi:GMP synthase (glutamine-hydrolysing)